MRNWEMAEGESKRVVRMLTMLQIASNSSSEEICCFLYEFKTMRILSIPLSVNANLSLNSEWHEETMVDNSSVDRRWLWLFGDNCSE